jgi:putative membrane protein
MYVFLPSNLSHQLILCPVTDGIHLKQCVTLYLFALPLTLVGEMGWATIPIATVVAFTFMGIEGIADEIEMPFGWSFAILCRPLILRYSPTAGTDDRDLPLGQNFWCSEFKYQNSCLLQIDIAKISKKRSSKSTFMCFYHPSELFSKSYTIERLPEGGEGRHGYDDGEGDD